MGQHALSPYSKLQEEGVVSPDFVVYLCLLQACGSVGFQAKQLHAQIKRRGLQADVDVGSSLLNMYAKCGNMKHGGCSQHARYPSRELWSSGPPGREGVKKPFAFTAACNKRPPCTLHISSGVTTTDRCIHTRSVKALTAATSFAVRNENEMVNTCKHDVRSLIL